MFGSFLPSLRSSSNHSLLGSRSRHCYGYATKSLLAALGDKWTSKLEELKGSPNILPWTRFDTDVAAGKLPNVSWVYAPGSPVELSEHPPFGKNVGQQTVKLGSQWTAERVHNLGQSQLWGTSVIS
jgi:hypothetical protein